MACELNRPPGHECNSDDRAPLQLEHRDPHWPRGDGGSAWQDGAAEQKQGCDNEAGEQECDRRGPCRQRPLARHAPANRERDRHCERVRVDGRRDDQSTDKCRDRRALFEPGRDVACEVDGAEDPHEHHKPKELQLQYRAARKPFHEDRSDETEEENRAEQERGAAVGVGAEPIADEKRRERCRESVREENQVLREWPGRGAIMPWRPDTPDDADVLPSGQRCRPRDTPLGQRNRDQDRRGEESVTAERRPGGSRSPPLEGQGAAQHKQGDFDTQENVYVRRDGRCNRGSDGALAKHESQGEHRGDDRERVRNRHGSDESVTAEMPVIGEHGQPGCQRGCQTAGVDAATHRVHRDHEQQPLEDVQQEE